MFMKLYQNYFDDNFFNYQSMRFFSLIFICIIGLTGCTQSTQLVKKGDKFAVRGEWDEAYLLYSEAHKMKPKNLTFRVKYLQSKTNAARIHFDRGVAYDAEGQYEAALLELQAATGLDPTYEKARRALKKVIKKIDSIYYYGKAMESIDKGSEEQAIKDLKRAITLNPKNNLAKNELKRIDSGAKIMLDGFELNISSTKPVTLDFKRSKIKKAFGVLSKLSGINFVFDDDVKDKNTTVHLENATFQEALSTILMINKLSRKVINENTIIIYPSTPKKAKQYEELKIEVFYLANSDAKKMVNLLRTMIKARDIFVHDDLNALVVRARPEALELANKILRATDLADAEVVLEVEVMEISRSKSLDFGLSFDPMSLSASLGEAGGSAVLQAREILDTIVPKDIFITIPSATYKLKKENLNAEILANPRIRVMNKEKAKIHIGDRIPIITATVNNGVTTESIEYQDVGLKLNVEPTVRPNDEVDLKISLEVSSLGTKTITSSGSEAYQIGTRNTETTLRLRDGETQLIGGLISEEERSTVIKIPILGDVPILGRLFSSLDKTKVKTDILLSITPHVVRNIDIPSDDQKSMWSGSSDSPSASRSSNVASSSATKTSNNNSFRQPTPKADSGDSKSAPEEPDEEGIYNAPPPPPPMFGGPGSMPGAPGF